MATPLRAFLMLKSQTVWDIAVFQDLDALVRAWEQRGDRTAIGVLHIGFERPLARLFNDLPGEFSGQVLLTSGAKFALPLGYDATDESVIKVGQVALFLAIQGWGYEINADAARTLTSETSPAKFSEWLESFVAKDPEVAPDLKAADIFDDNDYLQREARLRPSVRRAAGIYRFNMLCEDFEDPCKIAASAPPWLGELPLAKTAMTVRLSNVVARLGLSIVSDLKSYTVVDMLELPNCGRKSISDLVEALKSALIAGPIDGHKAAAAVESSSLLTAVESALLMCNEREREILSRRMGLRGPAETLQTIGELYTLTRERIRQLEAKALKRLRQSEPWETILTRKLRALVLERSYPLPIRAAETVDPWFTDIADRSEVFGYLASNLSSSDVNLIEIDGIEFVTLLSQERWQACVTSAKTVLSGGDGKNWTESECRTLVDSLLPYEGREFAELLWAKALQRCHFVSEQDGTRRLKRYGGSVEHLVEVILEESARPLHYNEIATAVSNRAKRVVDARRAHNAAANVGLLFSRGTYGLVKHTGIKVADLAKIAELAEDIVVESGLDRQWHSSELLSAVSERMEEEVRFDKYILDIALQRSGVLRGHGRMVWSDRGSPDTEAARIDVRQAIIATLQQAGRPLKAIDIRQRLIAIRGLGQHFQINQQDPLIRVGPATWGLNDRDVAIKRNEQKSFIVHVHRALEARGRGIHTTEASRLVEMPKELTAEGAFSIALLDNRMYVDSGQYLYLREWGSSRRKTIQEVVQSILSERSGFTRYDSIVATVEAEVGRPCGRGAISGSLQAVGAEFDGRGQWRLRGDLFEDEERTLEWDEATADLL